VLEIEFRPLTIPESRRREAVTAAFTQVLDQMIESRVAWFDKDAGAHAAKRMRREDLVAVPASYAMP
jgi:hypothetical protein